MKKDNNRFNKLECNSILKIFKKPKESHERFECLEVEGHKIQVGIKTPTKTALSSQSGQPTIENNPQSHQETSKVRISFLKCPKCGSNNEPDALYCLVCNYTFRDALEVKSSDLENWEIRCRGCGRTCNRNQENCLYCGWRVRGQDAKPEATASGPDKRVITVNIDGKEYKSTDRLLTPEVRNLMDMIRQRGYSKQIIDEWIKERNTSKELELLVRRQHTDERINQLRYDIIWRAVGLAIAVLFIIIYFSRFSSGSKY